MTFDIFVIFHDFSMTFPDLKFFHDFPWLSMTVGTLCKNTLRILCPSDWVMWLLFFVDHWPQIRDGCWSCNHISTSVFMDRKLTQQWGERWLKQVSKRPQSGVDSITQGPVITEFPACLIYPWELLRGVLHGLLKCYKSISECNQWGGT